MSISTTSTPSETPLNQEVMSLFSKRLSEDGVDSAVISAMTECYHADKSPSAEVLLVALKQAVIESEAEAIE